MYKIIGEMIEKTQMKSYRPTDFLKFFCLGQREECENLQEKLESVTKHSPQYKMLKAQRSMIYVHSKMAIFDDEYIIVGSANINERSLSGDRDTEICIGAFQPRDDSTSADEACEIKKFRKNLFCEHLGRNSECNDWEDPLDLFTQRKIDEIAEINWESFIAEEFTPMHSHLMHYPIIVENDGTVKPRTKYFPDTRGRVEGVKNWLSPDILTQ